MNEEISPEWFDEWFQRLFPPQDFYTPKEIYLSLQASKSTIYQSLSEGAIEAVRIGSAWRVPRVCLRRWLLSGWNLA